MAKVYVVIKTERGIQSEVIVKRSYNHAVEQFRKFAKEMDNDLSDSELDDVVEQEYFDYADDNLVIVDAILD